MWRPDGWDTDRILTDKWWDECDGLDSVGLVEEAVEAGADAMLKELVGWLKAHHRGSHRGFGHYGIYDSEIKDLSGVKE